MNRDKVKKQIILHIPYVFLALLGTKLGQAWRLAGGIDASKSCSTSSRACINRKF